MLVFAISLALAHLQGHDAPTGDGLKSVGFLMGDWNGKQNFVTGGDPLVGDVVAKFQPAIGGRYIEESLSVTLPGRKPTDVRHFLGFDPKSGHYKAWWFNDTSNSPTEFEGTVAGSKLVMESKPAPGGPGTVMRVTYELQKDGGLTYGLEMKMGTEWQSLFTTTYKKAPSSGK